MDTTLAPLLAAAEAVAALLGGTATEDQSRIRIDIGQPYQITARHPWGKKGMIEWSAEIPGNPHAYSPPSINTSETRDPRQIAADIRRRLMQPAKEWTAKKLQESRTREAVDTARNQVIQEISDRLGVEVAPAYQGIHWGRVLILPHDWQITKEDQRITCHLEITIPALMLILPYLKPFISR